MIPKLLLPSDVVNPQHLRMQYTDPWDGMNHLMTFYTGLLKVGHLSGRSAWELEVEFPLIAVVGPPFGPPSGEIAILPLHQPLDFQEFQGAVATGSISEIGGKTRPRSSAVTAMCADVRELQFSTTSAFAVVVNAKFLSDEREFDLLSYQVTVLTRVSPDFPTLAPILRPSSIWGARYAAIRDVAQMVAQQ